MADNPTPLRMRDLEDIYRYIRNRGVERSFNEFLEDLSHLGGEKREFAYPELLTISIWLTKREDDPNLTLDDAANASIDEATALTGLVLSAEEEVSPAPLE